MADLTLHGKPVNTVFDLLGDKENDITYSLGWGLANSDAFARELTTQIAEELGHSRPGEVEEISLQPHIPDGFMDVEILTSEMQIVIEAKRGWNLPKKAQLEKYARSMDKRPKAALVALAEGSPDFAAGRYPSNIKVGSRMVPVVYRSWRDMAQLAEETGQRRGNVEKRLLREFARYLRGLINMQNVESNWVYVVALSWSPADWTPAGMSPVDIVVEKRRYFHPVGGGRGGWPQEPANYLGFRFDGCLQQICQVERTEVFDKPRKFIPEYPARKTFDRPHYMYFLGPPIVPPQTVRTGALYRAQRVWAAIDLLLTSDTIRDARDATQARIEAAGA